MTASSHAHRGSSCRALSASAPIGVTAGSCRPGSGATSVGAGRTWRQGVLFARRRGSKPGRFFSRLPAAAILTTAFSPIARRLVWLSAAGDSMQRRHFNTRSCSDCRLGRSGLAPSAAARCISSRRKRPRRISCTSRRRCCGSRTSSPGSPSRSGAWGFRPEAKRPRVTPPSIACCSSASVRDS